tara:strand:- start:86 stop:634 length:549 start_codon:yes stop_codon:yes gene_type:complete
MKSKKMIKTSLLLRKLANILTLSRCLIAFVIAIAFNFRYLEIIWMLIIIAGISDYLDGYFARKSKIISPWGARLDPLADKLIMIGPFLWFIQNEIIPLWAIWLLISRELIISNWRASSKDGAPASSSAKVKTILQFISLILILSPVSYFGKLTTDLFQTGIYIFWISFIFSMISCFNYFKNQ